MASNTLNDRSDGQTITKEFFNDIHQALNGDLVGRNSSGVPTSGQNLGTAATPWGTARVGGLVIGGASVDVSQVFAPTHRVTSGKTRSSSNQPAFLTPAGSGGGATATLEGASTSLVYDVAGVSNTLSSDLNIIGLTTAPSTNNTCQVDDTDAADQDSTRTWGEFDAEKTSITIDTAGSEITSLVGQYACFQHGSEYFTAFIESSTKLSDCKRGFFYDDNAAPVNREEFSNNDTITLMSLGYVFLDDDGTTVDVTYTPPAYQNEAPSSPSTGDYWFDIPNALQKRYSGSAFETVDRVLVGYLVIDDTDCVAARSIDFDARYSSDNNLKMELQSNEIARMKSQDGLVNVAGNEIYYKTDRPQWNITTDLAGTEDMYNATEQASTFYFLYIDDEGKEIMSDIEPYRRPDLQGWYHPHNPWRMVGSAYNDVSSDLQFATEDLEAKSMSYQYSSDASQSISSGSNQIIDFEDTVYEDHDGLVVTGASWKWTAPAPGTFDIKTKANFGEATGWDINEVAVIRILRNGSDVAVDATELFTSDGTGQSIRMPQRVAKHIKLNRGDTVSVNTFQDSGGSKSFDGDPEQVFITLAKVGNR